MEAIKRHLFVAFLFIKEQWDRIVRWIDSVTLYSIVDVFPLSYSNRTENQIANAIFTVGACGIGWLISLIYKKLFSSEHKRVGLKNVASSSISDVGKSAKKLQLPDAFTSSSSSISAIFNAFKKKQPMVTSKASQSSDTFCTICMETKSASAMFSNPKVCRHLYCSNCISQHVSTKIKENITKVKCPDPKCKRNQKFYCPFKDCSAMLVDDRGEVVKMSECPFCRRMFCAQCKVAWHAGMVCKEFKKLRKDERNLEDIKLMQLAKKKKWKRCPRCKFFMEKLNGCRRIICRSGNHFCYGCGITYNGSHVCGQPEGCVIM